MSTWHFDQDEPLGDEDAFGQAWHAGNVNDWDWEGLNEDDLWDDGGLHDVPLATSPSPPPPLLPPIRNTLHGYNTTRAADTIFPPPHAHYPRATPPLLAGQRRTNTATTSRAHPNPPPSNRPPPPLQQGRFGYIVDHLFDDPTPPVDNPTPTGSDHSADFVTLDESSASESEAADMAPATRRRASARRSSLVDLTSGSSQGSAEQPARRGVKRAAESSAGRASKRQAQEQPQAEEVEEIDLANEAPSAEDELRQQQQREAIRAQQAAQEDQVPQRIGQRQCIICMENYTNATVTSCGHFFCHECLTQALMAGEKSSERGVGTCPVCRKPLSRKKKNEIIPIAFMKKDQFAKNQSKRLDILA